MHFQNPKMKILVKLPSRLRPEKFVLALDKYISLSETNPQYLITLDSDDPKVGLYNAIAQRYPNVIFDFGISGSKIAACNRGMNKTKDWDIVVLASDDMIPQVKGWDTKIIQAMETYFPDTDGVLHFDDGCQHSNCATLCIIGKKYYQRFGYLYNPKYISLWCDVEFTEVAIMLDRYKYMGDGNIIIKHFHPYAVKGVAMDDLYKQESTEENFNHDKKIWIENRKNRYFLGETPKDFKPEYNNV